MHKITGVSEAYGRAISTNFGFSSIAQSPPPERELPLPEKEKWSSGPGGGKEGKACEAYSSYLWLVHADIKRLANRATRGLQMDNLRTQPTLGTRVREKTTFWKSAHAPLRRILLLSVH